MMRHAGMFAALAALAGVAAVDARSAHGQNAVQVQPRVGTFAVPVTSFMARRFEGVIRQQYDFSCGAASVATLLTYHFRRPTTEREAFDAMYAFGDKEKIRQEGFSLYEMLRFLESLGYEAGGFRVPLETVERVGVPVIVMIEVRGYRHFVVVKGIRDGWVLVGDPALGLKRWTVPEFEELMADDIVFAITGADEIGRERFNPDREWAVLPSAPLGNAVDRSALAAFSVMLPSFSEFY